MLRAKPATIAVALTGALLAIFAVQPAASQVRRQPDPIDYAEHDGWVSLFDGKTLNDWSGDQNWRVEDGAIVIEPTCEHPTGTVYLIWQGGEVTNFEMKFEMKGTGAINGGMQYRSWIQPPPATTRPAAQVTGTCPSGAPRGTPPDAASEAQWNMGGPQYDFDAGNTVPGQFYEQGTGRARIAWRGQVVRTETGKNPRLVALLGDQSTVDSWFKSNDWNEAHIIALGNNMTHILNGHVMSVLFDQDSTKFNGSGHIGIEVESTGKLFVRNIWLKDFDAHRDNMDGMWKIAEFSELPVVQCPCGTTQRAFGDVAEYPGTIHLTRISEDALMHYHKTLTETYYFLECGPNASMRLDDETVPVRAGMCIVIPPGVRHRAIGKMTVLNIVFPKFDPADEWMD